jgi:hypothetical protein
VQRHGVAAHAIEGDMTRFWYDELYHVWQTRPAAIAGLTAHGPLFCFEQLAWDRGMRVVFRVEHKFAAGRIEHDIAGPLAMLRELDALETADAWPTCMANAVAQCPRGRAEIGREGRTTSLGGAEADSLYSWVIAPATKV